MTRPSLALWFSSVSLFAVAGMLTWIGTAGVETFAKPNLALLILAVGTWVNLVNVTYASWRIAHHEH